MTTPITVKLAGLLCTYQLTNQGKDMSFQVVLPNGRKVELCSKKVADEFLDTVGTDFISTNLTATDNQELHFAYMLLLVVGLSASPEKIASRIPESELRTLVDHTRHTLDTLSTDRDWLRSGTVSMDHALLSDAPDWFHTYHQKNVIRYLREEYEQVISDDLLVVCRACNGIVKVQNLDFSVAETGYPLFSEEVVESIGREDYERMVARLGQSLTNRYFEERGGLE
jgi:hypothetical protein